jgi:hypothetical protein
MKFTPKKHKKEEPRSKKVLWAIFITVLFVGSYFGFNMANGGNTASSYNGFTFQQKGNKIVTKVSGKEASFSFLPTQLEGLNMSKNISDTILATKIVMMTSDADSNFTQSIAQAKYELKTELLSFYSLYAINAFTTNTSYGLPVSTCGNASVIAPVIYFKESNITKATLADSCIILEARTQTEVIALKDRLMYQILGIMK